MPRSLGPRNIPCPIRGWRLYFTNRGGLSRHLIRHEAELSWRRRRERLLEQERHRVEQELH
jgi:hypothetical protein